MKNKYHVVQKTLREKEKLLVTSNFSFSHNVCHSYKSLLHQNVVLCGNGLNVMKYCIRKEEDEMKKKAGVTRLQKQNGAK